MGQQKRGNRKYEKVDKIMLYFVGACITALLSVGLWFADLQTQEFRMLNTTMVGVQIQMAGVQANQAHNSEKVVELKTELESLNSKVKKIGDKVGKISVTVSRTCERSKDYWQNHNGEC